MFDEDKIEELVDLLSELDSRTKLYFGCDSTRFLKNGKWYAKYATVVIVHKNGNRGCKIFSHKSVEPDFDKKVNKPSMRLMNEVFKVTQLYTELYPYIENFDIEIHLDISKDPKNGSNCVATQAAGYVLGVTGIEAKLKPESWAASQGADHAASRSI